MASGELTLSMLGVDEVVRRVSQAPGIMRGARQSALKATGYFFQQRLKDYAFSGSWRRLNPHTRVIERAKRWAYGKVPSGLAQNFEQREGRGKKRRRKRHIESTLADPMSRLRKGVRYRVPVGESFVEITFLRAGQPDTKLQRLVGMQEEERSLTVTRRMSRFFFGIGFPVPAGSTLTIPARPWFGPVFERQKEAALRRFEEAYYGAVARYWNRGGRA